MKRARTVFVALLLLAGLFAAVWWLPGSCTRPRALPAVEDPVDEGIDSPIAPVACAPHRERRCHLGDVWWLDGCGRFEARSEQCSGECRDGRCVPPIRASSCLTETPPLDEEGRCDGETLRYCLAGEARAVDCAARHQHCASDGEGGWNCMPIAHCSLPAGGLCGTAQTLLFCEGDRVRIRRCDPGQCETGADQKARCVYQRIVAADRIGRCHGCDCADGPVGDEVCDGYDNNRNGVVDEGVTCPTIDVVAFVLLDEGGLPVESNDRVEADIARTNRVLAEPGHDTGLQVRLREVRQLSRPQWLEMNDALIDAVKSDPEVSGAPSPFFVPLLYTRAVSSGAKLVGGKGTLPNHSCADVRLPGAGDGGGVILLAPTRSRTTLAHELGHFLGLCHTHMTPLRDALEHTLVHASGADDAPLDCPECARTGDGICDTPTDPGAGQGCVLDPASCTVGCPNGEAPDPANIMSYYTPCRRYFSAEQSMHLRRNLWRRMRWRECGAAVCGCGLDGDRDGRCDSAASRMRCELDSGQSIGRCAPAGSGQLFEPCSGGADCDADLLCAAANEEGRGRCLTPCLVDGASGCTCVPSASPSTVGVCALKRP